MYILNKLFMDLHNTYNTEVCFGTHLRVICTVFFGVFSIEHRLYLFRRCALRHTSAISAQFMPMFMSIGHGFFLFRRCVFRIHLYDLHSFYNYLCVSEMRETRDFVITNKGPMTLPWRQKAQGVMPNIGFKILVRFCSRVPASEF